MTVPVRLVTAVRERSVSFHMLTPDGKCRLRRKLVCPETGKEYDFKNTARGFEVAPDQYVLMEEEELDRLRPESGRTIEISSFVALEEIDPIYYNRTYRLVPEAEGAKPYQLLVSTMEQSEKVAIARFVLRQREHLVALRPKDGLLLLHTMYYADEIVPAPAAAAEAARKAKLKPQEVRIAQQLVDALTAEFDPTEYHDEYREKLEEAIQAKAEGAETVVAASEPAKRRPTRDLMEALKKSLAETEKPRRPAPRKRTTRARRRTA